MAQKKVIWTDEAKEDRKQILQYWAKRNRSKVYSEKLFGEFKDGSKAIAKQPFIGKATDVEDVRYIMVRDYAITYHISENLIHILSVWDERRDPETRPI